METKGVSDWGNRKFRIDGSYYVIKGKGYGENNLSADDIIQKYSIDSLEFLKRLHNFRKEVYKKLTSSDKLPRGETEIELNDDDFGFLPPGKYSLTPNPPETHLKHEIVHEAQLTLNKKLARWSTSLEAKLREEKRPFSQGVVQNLHHLEMEGFAAFISGSPDYANEFSDEIADKYIKCLYDGKYAKFEAGANEYSIGLHIFNAIEKAGHNAINVGIIQDPVEMIKAYEGAAKSLDINPVISTRHIEELVPNHRKIFYSRDLSNVPQSKRDIDTLNSMHERALQLKSILMEKMRKEGASVEKLQKFEKEMSSFAEEYKFSK